MSRRGPLVHFASLGVALMTALTLLLPLGGGRPHTARAQGGLEKINHIIVIFLENWSFDGLLSQFPGANGVAFGTAVNQVDTNGDPVVPTPVFYNLYPSVPYTSTSGDPVHEFYTERYQINGGKMDRFYSTSGVGPVALSGYDATGLPVGSLALATSPTVTGAVADNFFHGMFGDSYANHVWLLCACVLPWPNAPSDAVIQLDANGLPTNNGSVSPSGGDVPAGYIVDQPPNPTSQGGPVPLSNLPTIGDSLTAAGKTWTWYGYYEAMVLRYFQRYTFTPQTGNVNAWPPITYTQGFTEHVKQDTSRFYADLASGTLPNVAFIRQLDPYTEHPGWPFMPADQHVADIITAVRSSAYWSESMIIVTYDENGGRWDHVAPPTNPGYSDVWGPGTRLPLFVFSPFVKHKGYVDHTQYDTTSILRLIELRWGLPQTGTRTANPLLNMLDLGPTDGPLRHYFPVIARL